MESKEKEKLIRIVCKDNKLVYDPDCKMDGRGAYLCKDSPGCLEKAVKRKSFQRVFKRNLDPSDLEVM